MVSDRVKKNYKLIIIILLYITCFVSLGYAESSISANIEDVIASYRPVRDARVTNVMVSSVEGSALSNAEDYNTNKVYGVVNLPNNNSSVTYKIDVTVFLKSEMQLDEINGLNDRLEYSISNYTLGDVLCDSNYNCNFGAKKELYITIRYKDGMYDQSNTVIPFELNFVFNPINKSAKIEHTYFDTIESAIASVEAGTEEVTVYVLRDTQELIHIDEGKNIRLDFQDYVIRNTYERPIIENKGHLRLINANFESDSTQGALNVYSGGSLEMLNGKIVATAARQAVYIKGGDVEIGGTAYLHNSSSERAALQNEGGNLVVSGGTIIADNFSAIANKSSLVIGTKDGEVSTSSPYIQGKIYGLNTTRNIQFYDGILLGEEEAINNHRRLTVVEDDYAVVFDNYDIYKSIYLDSPKTVTFNPMGGIVSEESRVVNKNYAIGVLPVPTRENYVFDGWYDSDSVKYTKESIIVDDITLYAHWLSPDDLKIAQIGETKYDTLAEAISAAGTNPSEIILLRDTYENVTIEEGQDITFNFGSHTLSYKSNASTVTNRGKLKMVSGTLVSNSHNHAVVDNEGEFEITSGDIIANGQRQAVYNLGGKLIISGDAHLQNNTAARATVHSLNTDTSNAEVYVYGGFIESLRSDAIKAENGLVEIGKKDGNIVLDTPILQAEGNGITTLDSEFNFYDGTIKGFRHAINGSYNHTEDDADVVNGTEVIDHRNFTTAYVVKN